MKGTRQPLDVPPLAYNSPRVSPDGKWLAVGTDDGTDASIWIYDLAGTTNIQRLTLSGHNRSPIWGMDGTITFQSDREGDPGIFMQRLDGTAFERLTKSEAGDSHIPESWAPNGQTLLFTVGHNGVHSLHAYSRATQKETPFYGVQSVYPPSSMFSPDGNWVAYYERLPGSETGALFVHAFQKDEVHEVWRGGGIHPFWSQQGTSFRLYYRLPQTFNSVDVTTHPTFGFTKPVEWPFGLPLTPGPEAPRSVDITPDGKTFVSVASAGASPTQLTSDPDVVHLVQNWTEDMKARVPTK
jgi:hypothetical protein